MTSPAKSEQSVGELLSALAHETGVLVRQEVKLASSEMTAKTVTVGRALGMIGVGGAFAHAGLLALMAALFVGLARVIPLWLSALVVGVVILGVGYALVQKGLSALKHLDPVPQQTMSTLKDDRHWVKEQVR
jgi:uncharacterized membrane protein YqjE